MKQYFYSDGENQFGPLTLEELKDQNLKPDTLIWYPGLESWIRLNDSEKLRTLLFSGRKPIIELADAEVPEVYIPSDISNKDVRDQVENREIGGMGKPPKNWLLESILVTIFCCNPLAVVGIIYAAQVDTVFYKGDHQKAIQLSRDAALWVRIALGVSFFFMVFYLFIVLFELFAG